MPGYETATPEAWRRSAALREKYRAQALDLLARPKGLSAKALSWARHWAGMPALVVPAGERRP